MSKELVNVTRRNFLKSALAAAGGAALAGSLTGCSAPDAPSSGNLADSGNVQQSKYSGPLFEIGEIAEPSETISADIVVAGGGGTGLGAAIQAAQLGLSVVVVDVGKQYGGSFVNTEGMSGVKSSFLEELDPNPEVEEVVAACMDYHHWVPNHQLYMNFFNKSGDTIDWCQELGAKFSMAAKTPTSVSYVHIYDHSEDKAGDLPGQVFMDHLGEAADKLGVQPYFETAARKVILNEGKVAGLLAERTDGSVIQIDAPAVIIATGGYSTNEEMLRYLSDIIQNEEIFSLGAEVRDGSGFKMALDAGGWMAPSPGTVQWCGPVIPGCGWCTDGYAAAVQPTLWVNQDAERFCPEDLWINNFAAAGIAQARQLKTYTIISEADLQYFEKTGPYVNVFTWKKVGTPIPEARSQFESLDNVHHCDTIEEVAQALDLDAASLKKTLDEYNQFCETGEDLVFGKTKEHLRKMEGPFWAAQISCGYYCTDGGIYISPNFEVLNRQGEVIPGLYAGGKDSGGLFGDSYDVLICPGTGAGYAINSGRLAAESAKAYIDTL